MRDPSRSPNRRSAGFTLVEIIIALAIFAVVIAQAFAVFGAQHATYTGTERSIEVQEDVRLVTDAIQSELRMAGYMVPKIAGISSVDGGNAAADMICISDPSKLDDLKVDDATARFDKAQIAAGPVGAGAASVQVDTLDIDANGVADFVDTETMGIIIADGTSSHCARITGITGNTIDFTPDTPAGFLANTSGRVTPAIIYDVSGTDLRRNGMRLSSQVEDLQIEFGIDGDADGQIAAAEFLDTLQGSDPLDMLAVRLSVIARADREDDELKTGGRPAAANRTAGAADGFRRRKIIARLVPRNLL